MRNLTPALKLKFRRLVLSHYKHHGRALPWRNTSDPYRILVSEIMLQQTQVWRVLPKYAEFIKKFPSFRALTRASVSDVVQSWQGLGYNRRALALKQIAETVITSHRGTLPRSRKALEALPGIGPYTASAVRVFAFGEPEVLIETNIRSVFLHHFFKDRTRVSDRMLLPLVEATLDRKDPRQWYYALMDYGSALKSTMPNPSRRSAHYTKQSKFEGSRRQLRGKVLKLLTTQSPMTKNDLAKRIPASRRPELSGIIAELIHEGFIKVTGKAVSLC